MRKLFTACIMFLLLSSCKKETLSTDELTTSRLNTLPEVKAALMKEILSIAKHSSEFRKTVESECLKQVRGDYNVALDKILEIDKLSSIIPQDQKKSFTSLVNQMKEFRPGEMPIIFVPVMESRDPSIKHKRQFLRSSESETITIKIDLSAKAASQIGLITMVDQANEVKPNMIISSNYTNQQKRVNIIDPEDPGGGGPIACTAPDYYPGYIIDNYGNLTYSECINEAFAWNHDVWVLGYEEIVSSGNDVASAYDVNAWVSTNNRWEGFEEGGGMVQVPNLGAIEPWVRGKPEFKYFVSNSTGTLIKDHVFGKWSRSNFDGGAWVDLKDFIGNWNTNVWGNVTYEHWIEEDGGNSTSFSQNISYVINGITYTTTFTIPARNGDDDLGMANIQFSDPVWYAPYVSSYKTVYTLNNMNVQRTHYY